MSLPKAVKVEMSDQAYEILEKIAATGLWGRNVEEVITRIVDQRLWEWTDKPILRLRP